MDTNTYLRVLAFFLGCTYIYIHSRTHVCMYVCMHVCISVCMCAYVGVWVIHSFALSLLYSLYGFRHLSCGLMLSTVHVCMHIKARAWSSFDHSCLRGSASFWQFVHVADSPWTYIFLLCGSVLCILRQARNRAKFERLLKLDCKPWASALIPAQIRLSVRYS